MARTIDDIEGDLSDYLTATLPKVHFDLVRGKEGSFFSNIKTQYIEINYNNTPRARATLTIKGETSLQNGQIVVDVYQNASKQKPDENEKDITAKLTPAILRTVVEGKWKPALVANS